MNEEKEKDFNKFYNFWSNVSHLSIGNNLLQETLEALTYALKRTENTNFFSRGQLGEYK
jgi:hypothetical protein